MLLTDLRVGNFRVFGEGGNALVLHPRPGLTALIGENDTGKTAAIDALRLELGTRDQETFRIDEDDFHQPPNSTERRTEIRVRSRFSHLSQRELESFVEYLTYEDQDDKRVPVLYAYCRVIRGGSRRRPVVIETRSGKEGDGPQSAKSEVSVFREAVLSWSKIVKAKLSREALASHAYEPYISDSKTSKATGAQYLARLLQRNRRQRQPLDCRSKLPRYLVDAIDYVTKVTEAEQGPKKAGVLDERV